MHFKQQLHRDGGTLRSALIIHVCALILWGWSGGVRGEKFFDSGHLMEVRISLPADDWAELCSQTRNFAQALSEERKDGVFSDPFSYFAADVTIDGREFKGVGIRKKGFLGSLDPIRPSLKVKLDYGDADYEIEGMDKLTLNNCKQDAPIINQYLAYRLFNAAGVPAPRASFAHVWVNGQNLGIYCNVESMEKPMIRRHFGNADGALFEGTATDFYPGWQRSIEHKFGDEKWGMSRIGALIEALEMKGGESLEVIEKIVDLDSFIRYWAVEGLIGFWDGYSGNSNNYFFHIPESDGKMHFMPWGADSVFTTREMFRQNVRYQSIKTSGRLAGRLYSFPEIRQRYASALREVLEKHWDEEAMLNEVDQFESLLGPHVHSEQAGYDRAMDELRDFIRNRRESLLTEIADGLPDDVEVREQEPLFFSTIARMDIKFSGEWRDGGLQSAKSATGEVTGSVTYGEEAVDMEGSIVVAGPAPRRGFGFGRREEPDEPPVQLSIKIPAENRDDSLTWNIMIEGAKFKVSDDAVPGGGTLVKGQPRGFFFGPGGSMVEAEVVFDAVSTTEKGRVSGTIKARAMQMSRSPFSQ